MTREALKTGLVGDHLGKWIVEVTLAVCPRSESIVLGINESATYGLMCNSIDNSSADTTTRVEMGLLVLR